jgi:hypothetical protein
VRRRRRPVHLGARPIAVVTTYKAEIAHYEAKVDGLRRDQLKTVQSAATRWTALTSTLLGVFGTVAFAGGLRAVDTLSSPLDIVVRALTSVAAGSAILAIWFLARAAGGLVLAEVPVLTGLRLMEREAELVPPARRNLGKGKVLALVAAGLVVAGSVAVLWAPVAPAPVSGVIVRFPDAAFCGRPSLAGGRLMISGRSLGEAVDVVPVAACPSDGGKS